jgi:hypothetical protein
MKIFKNQIDSKIKIYEAHPNALKNITIGRTLAEARALGPLKTPRQYQCSFCGSGVCGIVVNVVQCFCGPVQCPPATTASRKFFLFKKKIIYIDF